MMKNKLTINTAQAQKIKESAVCEIAVNLCLDMPSKVNKVDQPSRYIETELGKEKLCIECNEYWPLDDEFWLAEIRLRDMNQFVSLVMTFDTGPIEPKQRIELNLHMKRGL